MIGPDGLHCRNSKSIKSWMNLISSLSQQKPHILVSAPSNIAVDNIIQRIMEKGFTDGNYNNKYYYCHNYYNYYDYNNSNNNYSYFF